MTDNEYILKYSNKEDIEKNLKKLKKNFPVQYIIGNVNFYGYQFKVNKNVLIPRFETEELIEKTLQLIKQLNITEGRILDVGTGSGCIAITLKHQLPNFIIDALDISNKALKVAQENALLNQTNINFIKGNIINKKQQKNIKYNIIISNPPYIKKGEIIDEKVKKYEPKRALYAKEEGLYYYKKILTEYSSKLTDKYLICFEIGETQAKEIFKIAKEILNNPIIIVKKDLNQRDRFVFIYKS